jgi:small subunit ribosomal protein S18
MNGRRGRRKVCRICEDKGEGLDYRNERLLRRYINERGKIIPRRTSGACARHQRQLRRVIKRARHMALLPFQAEMVK